MNQMLQQTNSIGRAFVEFAGPMLIQSSVLILILLLVDLFLRKKVRAVFRYWIWMLVLVKLVLPTSLSLPMSFGYWFGDKLGFVQKASLDSPSSIFDSGLPFGHGAAGSDRAGPIEPAPMPRPELAPAEPIPAEPISSPPVSLTPLSWQGALFLAWLAVVVVMSLLLLQRAIFVRGLIAQAEEATGLMKDTLHYCCEHMAVKIKVRLKVSPNASSPAVCGLFCPVILVPRNLSPTLGSSHLRTVLMHELAHIKRGDLWINTVQTALQIIYLYNPLLWLANAIIRRVREQAVDEIVLVAMGHKAQQYPETLLSVAKLAFARPALSLRLIGVIESKNQLKERIRKMLERPVPKSAKLGILSLLAIIIAAAMLLPMAAAEDKGQMTDDRMEKEFAATLPNGVTVELIGICEHPSQGKQWWRPDGAQSKETPYDYTGGNVYPDQNERAYEFAIALDNLPAEPVTTTIKTDRAGSSSGGNSPPQKNGKYLDNLRWLATVLPRNQKTCDVLCGIAAGPWEAVAQSSGKDFSSQVLTLLGGVAVAFSKAFVEADGVSITVTDDILERPCQIVAITNENRLIKPSTSSSTSAGKARQTTASFKGLALSGVKEFQFQTRPYQWVTFKNVSLKPGVKTSVQVEFEKPALQVEVERTSTIRVD